MSSPDAININRLSDGLYLDINPGFERITGFERTDVIGKTSAEINIWRNLADRARLVEALERDSVCSNFEADFIMKDGSVSHGLMSASVVRVNDEVCILSITRDITEFNRLALALADSEKAYRATFDQAAVGIARVAPDGSWLEVNQKLAEMVAYTHDELLQLTFQDITHPDDLDADLDNVSRMLDGSLDTYAMEKRYVRKSGEVIWVNLTVALVRTEDGSPDYFIAVVEDINARKLNEAQLHKLSMAVEQSPNSIVITDLEANIEYANLAFCSVSGYTIEEMLGKNPRILQSGKTPQATYRDMWAQLVQGEAWHGELVNHRKDGSEYTEMVIIAPVRDASGKVTNYLATKENITEKKQSEARIQQLAYFDQLTGLPNRSQLNDRFNYLLSLAQRHSKPLTVMFLDLDHFKNINDSLGHSIGDKLLMEIARRLKDVLRDQDTLSRLGGDEFILVLPETGEEGSRDVALKLISSVVQPCQIEQYELVTTVSIGIALYPHDGQDFETLSRNADAAMYRVKQSTRNDYRFFTEEMQQHSVRALLLVNALRHALTRNELELYYQPQLAMQDGRIVGAEALLRWLHPELGMISPAEFIPIAEESGQIMQIGEWVLRTAVNQLKRWMDEGMPPMVVAVNLSAVQFRHPNLLNLVTQILEEAQLAPEYLELELTEATAMDDPNAAIEVMNKLHESGIRMSIDDFGTGYSSLSYLKKFKVYKLKIDQSFVRDLSDDQEDKAIVTAIINMASSLGMHTIAEGVETASQLAFLRLQGCDESQGYYFSKPLTVSQFAAFVNKA
ncbi:MAG: EAL domain-containing protein [Gallionella sp.]|nr:EAL domain-containing protein [Gallionella sp.]MDP1939583.1 EAL domain-containing protein [Gallionella sp.]